MAQKVHLQDGLIPAHGHHGEFLDADELVVLGVLCLGREGSDLCAADKCILADSAGKPGLVLADLAFDVGDGCVDGGIHVGGAFAGPEEDIGGVYRQLYHVPVLLNGKSDKSFGVIAEIAIQLRNLFCGVGMNAFRQGDFFLVDLDFHSASLLSSALRNHPVPLSLLYHKTEQNQG